jgi:hypothetical protein
MSDLLSGFEADERALLVGVLKREAGPGRVGQPYRKPTDAELIAAGWKRPPSPPPTEIELLRMMRQECRDLGPRGWLLLSRVEDDVLLALHEREPHLLRHKTTKRWGHMWRLAKLDK